MTTAGKTPRVTDVHVIALYEQDTGRIKHVHTVTVFEGGRNITEKEAIEAARTHAGRMTDFFYAAIARQSLRAANVFKRSFQNAFRRRLAPRQRSARTFSAPGLPQNMPDCLHRDPMTVLHPASTTPEPMNNP